MDLEGLGENSFMSISGVWKFYNQTVNNVININMIFIFIYKKNDKNGISQTSSEIDSSIQMSVLES